MKTTTKDRPADEAGHRNYHCALEMLANCQSYPETTHTVERIDTHISSVFLTDRYVYKLKKPVKFDFLDFSTADKRRHACEQEVRLNRRLARDVYLGVVPIVESSRGRLKLDGPGKRVDWLVKMRRLPRERALDHLIASGAVCDADVAEVAAVLCRFYEQLPPLNINVEDHRRRIEEHVLANERALSKTAGLDASVVRRVHELQLRLLRLAPGTLDARVCDGRIVDGHGDLRPEHIYFNPRPTIIDCIEFNDEFRQLDVLDDLAFLAVECEHLQAAWIGERIIEAYRRASGDRFSQPLLDFYKTYRACVRAKVAALRAGQANEASPENAMSDAGRHLQVAERHAARLGPPLLLVVYGLSGTGKSTLAARLSELLQVNRLSTDVVRRELFADREAGDDIAERLYDPATRESVYDEMLDRADALLEKGVSVILDGTFQKRRTRERAVELARRRQAAPLFVHCHCSESSAMERIVHRAAEGSGDSDATVKVYQDQLAAFEPDAADAAICHVDTDRCLTEVAQSVFADLRELAGLSQAEYHGCER